MKEWSSYDTVGNAFFTLIQFAKPLRWRHIAIVTSDFHMPRCKAIFEWVYGLHGAGPCHSSLHADSSKQDGRSQGYILEYHSVSDQGLDETALKNRVAMEEQLLTRVEGKASKIRSVQEFHHHLFFETSYYSTAKQDEFGKHPVNSSSLY